MDFKKLFRKDDKAVSPVIGVILMVAITVILAAAIGSSVFSHGTAKSAPQANFDLRAVPAKEAVGTTPATPASVRFEHLGGDMIHFDDATTTKVMATIGSAEAIQIEATTLGDFGVGNVKTIPLTKVGASTAETVPTNTIVNIKVVDIQTNQIICDKNLRF